LKSISVLGPAGEHAPKLLKVYINRQDIDFDSVDDITPTQQWDMVQPMNNQLPEYKTKASLFSNVTHLVLFFESNYGEETTKISYIGLKGEHTTLSRDPIITNYEASANPADHKTFSVMSNSNSIQ
jgi:hypothetical protein